MLTIFRVWESRTILKIHSLLIHGGRLKLKQNPNFITVLQGFIQKATKNCGNTSCFYSELCVVSHRPTVTTSTNFRWQSTCINPLQKTKQKDVCDGIWLKGIKCATVGCEMFLPDTCDVLLWTCCENNPTYYFWMYIFLTWQILWCTVVNLLF